MSRRLKNGVAGLAILAGLSSGLVAGNAFADVLIAMAGPMSGPVASYGVQARAGVEAAIADINEKGGLLGEKVVLTVVDEACDAKQAVAVANRLVSENPVAVIGHICSGATIAASDVYAEEGIPMISPTATSPQLTERGLKQTFRTCGRDDQQGEVAAKLILEKYKDKKVAIIHDKQAYGQGLADDVAKRLKAAGMSGVIETSITAGERDYSSLVSRMKTDGVEFVYYGGYEQELGLIVRQAADQQWKPQFMGADGIQTSSFWNIAGDTAQGTLFTFAPDPQRNAAAAPVVAAMHAKGITTDGFTLFGYAATQTLAQAITQAGSKDADAIVKALHAGSFETVLGTLQFDEKGDLRSPGYAVWAWEAGKQVQRD